MNTLIFNSSKIESPPYTCKVQAVMGGGPGTALGLLQLVTCSQGPSPALCLPLRLNKFWLPGSKRQNSKETNETETSPQN